MNTEGGDALAEVASAARASLHQGRNIDISIDLALEAGSFRAARGGNDSWRGSHLAMVAGAWTVATHIQESGWQAGQKAFADFLDAISPYVPEDLNLVGSFPVAQELLTAEAASWTRLSECRGRD